LSKYRERNDDALLWQLEKGGKDRKSEEGEKGEKIEEVDGKAR
jgi:hypothetical protein